MLMLRQVLSHSSEGKSWTDPSKYTERKEIKNNKGRRRLCQSRDAGNEKGPSPGIRLISNTTPPSTHSSKCSIWEETSHSGVLSPSPPLCPPARPLWALGRAEGPLSSTPGLLGRSLTAAWKQHRKYSRTFRVYGIHPFSIFTVINITGSWVLWSVKPQRRICNLELRSEPAALLMMCGIKSETTIQNNRKGKKSSYKWAWEKRGLYAC